MIEALEGSPASVCDYMKAPAVFILRTTYHGPIISYHHCKCETICFHTYTDLCREQSRVIEVRGSTQHESRSTEWAGGNTMQNKCQTQLCSLHLQCRSKPSNNDIRYLQHVTFPPKAGLLWSFLSLYKLESKKVLFIKLHHIWSTLSASTLVQHYIKLIYRFHCVWTLCLG